MRCPSLLNDTNSLMKSTTCVCTLQGLLQSVQWLRCNMQLALDWYEMRYSLPPCSNQLMQICYGEHPKRIITQAKHFNVPLNKAL